MMSPSVWFENLQDAISQIADEESQRLAWCERRPIDFPSVAEIYCQFFDDADVLGFVENEGAYKKCGVTPDKVDAIKKLAVRMTTLGRNFGANPSDECLFFLDHRWQEIINAANNYLDQ